MLLEEHRENCVRSVFVEEGARFPPRLNSCIVQLAFLVIAKIGWKSAQIWGANLPTWKISYLSQKAGAIARSRKGPHSEELCFPLMFTNKRQLNLKCPEFQRVYRSRAPTINSENWHTNKGKPRGQYPENPSLPFLSMLLSSRATQATSTNSRGPRVSSVLHLPVVQHSYFLRTIPHGQIFATYLCAKGRSENRLQTEIGRGPVPFESVLSGRTTCFLLSFSGSLTFIDSRITSSSVSLRCCCGSNSSIFILCVSSAMLVQITHFLPKNSFGDASQSYLNVAGDIASIFSSRSTLLDEVLRQTLSAFSLQ